MKAKFAIGAAALILMSALPANAGGYHNSDFGYASRINRFHRSYTSFTYYSPVFTDTYGYGYRPNVWAVSAYSTWYPGISFSWSIPARTWGFGLNIGWYDPWYDPYYAFYDPWDFYGGWYTPVVYRVKVRNYWHYSDFYRHGNDRWYRGYPAYYSRNKYNVHNNYYYSDRNTDRYTPDVNNRSANFENRSSRTPASYNRGTAGYAGRRNAETGRNNYSQVAPKGKSEPDYRSAVPAQREMAARTVQSKPFAPAPAARENQGRSYNDVRSAQPERRYAPSPAPASKGNERRSSAYTRSATPAATMGRQASQPRSERSIGAATRQAPVQEARPARRSPQAADARQSAPARSQSDDRPARRSR